MPIHRGKLSQVTAAQRITILRFHTPLPSVASGHGEQKVAIRPSDPGHDGILATVLAASAADVSMWLATQIDGSDEIVLSVSADIPHTPFPQNPALSPHADLNDAVSASPGG